MAQNIIRELEKTNSILGEMIHILKIIDAENSKIINTEGTKIKHKENNKQTQCCICLYAIKKEPHFLPCVHSFHITCIQKWLKQSNQCPICRSIVNA